MDQTEFLMKPCEAAVGSHHNCLAVSPRSLDVADSNHNIGEVYYHTGLSKAWKGFLHNQIFYILKMHQWFRKD